MTYEDRSRSTTPGRPQHGRGRQAHVPARAIASRGARALAGAGLIACALAGCGVDRHTAVDLAMGSAYRPPGVDVAQRPASARERDAESLQLLAGDFHCHVSPPDWDQEANRDLAGTVTLAKKEHLDFVVLTPHVRA